MKSKNKDKQNKTKHVFLSLSADGAKALANALQPIFSKYQILGDTVKLVFTAL